MKSKVVALKSKLRRDRECEVVLRQFREMRREYGRLIREKKKAAGLGSWKRK